MPTTAQVRFSAAGRLDPMYRGENAFQEAVNLMPSLTYVAGTVLGELTATPGTFGPYASGNADGTQNPKALLTYACVTDASSNITMVGEFSQTRKDAPAYFKGYFRSQDLTGMDAAGLTKMGGALISGTLTTGVIKL